MATKLRAARVYATYYSIIAAQIRRVCGHSTKIAHVGGTALKPPIGKGDLDIYMAYEGRNDRRRMKQALDRALGRSGNVTRGRVRYNAAIRGVSVEVQLTDERAFRQAVILRDYLRVHPRKAAQYVRRVRAIRDPARERVGRIKERFGEMAERATRESRRAV